MDIIHDHARTSESDVVITTFGYLHGEPHADRPTPAASTWRKSSRSGGDCVEIARLLPGGGCHCCGGDGTMGGATCSVCNGTGQCGGGR